MAHVRISKAAGKRWQGFLALLLAGAASIATSKGPPGPSSRSASAEPIVLAQAGARAQRRLTVRVERKDLPQDALLTVWMEPKLVASGTCPDKGSARDYAVRMLVRTPTPMALGSEHLLLGCVELPARRIAWSPINLRSQPVELEVTFERGGTVPGDVRFEWRLEAEISGLDSSPSSKGVSVIEEAR